MMQIPTSTPKKLQEWVQKRAEAIWTNLNTNHLWQRMLKNTLATTITVIIAMLPATVRVYGKAAYLGPITTVFGHPGRRFGMMAEALVLAISGTMLGIGWSMFGLYLSSLVYHTNSPAAYTIRGLFLAVALMFHGFLRSHTPRLFIMVLLLVIVSVVSLTSVATEVSKTSVTQLLYPILTAAGVLLLVNTCVFPEFSSSFLGITTIETLGDTVGVLRDAESYFVSLIGSSEEEGGESKDIRPDEESDPATASETPKEKIKDEATPSLMHRFAKVFNKTPEYKEKAKEGPKTVKLKSLTDSKAKLRAKLASCKAAQQECNFELAWAVLPPRDLKPISDTNMKLLVANTIALIGACESKYALMGDEDDKTEDESKDDHQLSKDAETADLESEDESSHPATPTDDSHDDSDERTRSWKTRKTEKRRKKSRIKSKTHLEEDKSDLELVKPRKEIEFGDVELLKYLVNLISKPLSELQEKIDRSVDAVTSCLAYCYDVPKLPSGAPPPTGIELQELDIRVEILTEALSAFDKDSASALEGAAQLHDMEHPHIDIMPRMETFLISSFLLNLRQAALHTLEMLKHSRVLVERRQARRDRHRIYAPRINWRKWLQSGGEEDMLALPESGRKDARSGNKNEEDNDEGPSATSNETLLAKKDVESGATIENDSPRPAIHANQAAEETKKIPEKISFVQCLRIGLADSIEYLVGSDDVAYALKLTFAVFLVTWPAFLHQWNAWYSLNRGLWAALQLVLITEVALGTSVMTFALRAVGTIIGCIWGYAAYEARNGNRVVCVIILVIGFVPSTYIQLGSKYVKAGMVSIISMCIVALATVDHTVPGSATENFLKRLVAFLIGGVVALIVEVIVFPVKARDRLVESLAASIWQISEMEGCLAYGIETEVNIDVHSKAVSERFSLARGKAEGALGAAETFLPFCANEPRLKGSFKGLALVYAEILYVLHAIVDRMDNMLLLRQEYGSGVLEELNKQVYPYRRNVAGSITLVLFAVHEALSTKLPLPQFLPSARLAHLRMVNRVREVVLAKMPTDSQASTASRSSIELTIVKRVVRQKFLSWNAASAGQMEVIEYLEELIDLTKLLVGANEFRSGMLTRLTYRGYVDRIDRSDSMEKEQQQQKLRGTGDSQKDDEQDEMRDQVLESEREVRKLGLTRRRTTFSKKEGLEKKSPKQVVNEESERQRQAEEEELPRSLQRVRSRRVEEMTSRLEKSRSKDVKNGKRTDKSQ